MDFDLKGYLETEPLALSRPLLPLFEAVVNAIDAVEFCSGDRRVSIHVERDTRQFHLAAGGGHGSKQIVGFRVKDNGIGFTDANFQSFNTSFSRYKKARGGKGVGRFSWLQAFDETTVTSVYQEDSSWHRRQFTFSTSLGGGVGEHSVVDIEPEQPSTTVWLKGFKKRYADSRYCPTKADTLAWKLLEHCLFTFMAPSPPNVSVSDDDESTPFSLNELYKMRVSPFATENNVTIGSQEFRLRHLRLYSGDPSQQHSIHLCANGRDVLQLSLEKRIPSLSRKLEDENGLSFYYQCYVESPFLDERANVQRTDFALSREGELQLGGDLTQESLIDDLLIHCKNQLGDHLDKLYNNIKEKAEQLVTEKYPEFRTLLKEFDTYVDEFGQDASDEQLLRKFNELHFARELDTRQQAQQLLAKVDKGEYDEAYEEQFKHYFESVDETATINLARYVIHRKAILNLLRKRIESKTGGKYDLEQAVHEVVFPMRRSSDDIEYHRWNLWIVDEKLAFHFYLSSDRPISDVTGNSQDGKEPDILVIDNPAAFADTERTPLNAVVIVEFKRPERTSYKDEGKTKNPIDQVQGYINDIRENKEVTVRGRPIIVTDNTPFYCYILADLTPKLREIASNRGFICAPDGLGYFWFNPNNNAYIELLSFDKLIQDAEQRNAALFKKLGLH